MPTVPRGFLCDGALDRDRTAWCRPAGVRIASETDFARSCLIERCARTGGWVDGPRPGPGDGVGGVGFAGGVFSKRAGRRRAGSIVTWQAPVPEQPLDQPANSEPAAGCALSVTTVPSSYEASQTPPGVPQPVIPAGLEADLPGAASVVVTFNAEILAATASVNGDEACVPWLSVTVTVGV